ncbi:MAG: hydrogenase formation protein HypD [Candidatus Nezhaarchaeota archaeon]|nr:hydrogenase formation protein HypD [Candidatus Nezhaarchaeota archaeon]
MLQPLESYRDKELVLKVARAIREASLRVKEVKIMHVCGTHEQVISQHGIRSLLPANVKVIAGPGCPVCVVPAREVDEAIKLALEHKVVLATFGDMYRVPGSEFSLAEARALGGDVRVVYSISDAVKIAEESPSRQVAFFSIGFETTAPTTASMLIEGVPRNFSVLVSHRLIPPAMELLMGVSEVYFDGFICPGHVATIIGTRPFKIFPEFYRMPTVIAGFEPLDVLLAVKHIVDQVEAGVARLVNEYRRLVREDGNVKAQRLMEEVFEVCDARWRGIGRVPSSGLRLKEKYGEHDARLRFNVKVEGSRDLKPGCSCHLVLIGKLAPPECPLFAKACTPRAPQGPCMVSSEGTCNIWYRYGGKLST